MPGQYINPFLITDKEYKQCVVAFRQFVFLAIILSFNNMNTIQKQKKENSYKTSAGGTP